MLKENKSDLLFDQIIMPLNTNGHNLIITPRTIWWHRKKKLQAVKRFSTWKFNARLWYMGSECNAQVKIIVRELRLKASIRGSLRFTFQAVKDVQLNHIPYGYRKKTNHAYVPNAYANKAFSAVYYQHSETYITLNWAYLPTLQEALLEDAKWGKLYATQDRQKWVVVECKQ